MAGWLLIQNDFEKKKKIGKKKRRSGDGSRSKQAATSQYFSLLVID
jgi:hypothetical protein